ncbi:hypothetical protein SKAU_G00386460 [Synaphobranchus kaupii]|uniref:Uncharacterized protein n=1 Tax=Synaphobranchus kaupii TaxID=118154 RepID=A0A9Q1IFA6_SYNKA|nr:hypothetical protein SKAU_G00386460 [Synaphobranchus kaupii]
MIGTMPDTETGEENYMVSCEDNSKKKGGKKDKRKRGLPIPQCNGDFPSAICDKDSRKKGQKRSHCPLAPMPLMQKYLAPLLGTSRQY